MRRGMAVVDGDDAACCCRCGRDLFGQRRRERRFRKMWWSCRAVVSAKR